MLGKAIAIASNIHEAQRDKGGSAYILHLRKGFSEISRECRNIIEHICF